MSIGSLLVRAQPVMMIAIDVITPIALMGFLGSLLGKVDIGLAFGFALGLFSYFRHWSRGDVQPAVVRLFGRPVESKNAEGTNHEER